MLHYLTFSSLTINLTGLKVFVVPPVPASFPLIHWAEEIRTECEKLAALRKKIDQKARLRKIEVPKNRLVIIENYDWKYITSWPNPSTEEDIRSSIDWFCSDLSSLKTRKKRIELDSRKTRKQWKVLLITEALEELIQDTCVPINFFKFFMSAAF